MKDIGTISQRQYVFTQSGQEFRKYFLAVLTSGGATASARVTMSWFAYFFGCTIGVNQPRHWLSVASTKVSQKCQIWREMSWICRGFVTSSTTFKYPQGDSNRDTQKAVKRAVFASFQQWWVYHWCSLAETGIGNHDKKPRHSHDISRRKTAT